MIRFLCFNVYNAIIKSWEEVSEVTNLTKNHQYMHVFSINRLLLPAELTGPGQIR